MPKNNQTQNGENGKRPDPTPTSESTERPTLTYDELIELEDTFGVGVARSDWKREP